MYSSLRKIDVTASTPNGPLYVQTDHRSADEIAAEPEISKAILLVSEGAVVDHAQLGKGEPEHEPTTSPPKKPGLLKRLFGKN